MPKSLLGSHLSLGSRSAEACSLCKARSSRDRAFLVLAFLLAATPQLLLNTGSKSARSSPSIRASRRRPLTRTVTLTKKL